MGFCFWQFSVTEHFQGMEAGRMQSPPGVFFYYDLSPIKVCLGCFWYYVNNTSGNYVSKKHVHFDCCQVIFEEQHVEFLHFLTNVCAIVGGNGYISLLHSIKHITDMLSSNSKLNTFDLQVSSRYREYQIRSYTMDNEQLRRRWRLVNSTELFNILHTFLISDWRIMSTGFTVRHQV